MNANEYSKNEVKNTSCGMQNIIETKIFFTKDLIQGL